METPSSLAKSTIQTRNCGSLFCVALDAARGIAAPFRSGGQQPALVSIVFSVFAFEAFMNEVVDMAAPYYSDPAISLFLDFMNDAEKSRASFESKVILGRWILAGEKIDKGVQSYQDFALLMNLRNGLPHFKATPAVGAHLTPEQVHEDLIKKFTSKHILADRVFTGCSWLYLIETKAVAGWACKTISRMVVDFFEKMPTGMWREFTEGLVMAFALTESIPNRVETWPLIGPDPE
jgi:hypothetical protein